MFLLFLWLLFSFNQTVKFPELISSNCLESNLRASVNLSSPWYVQVTINRSEMYYNQNQGLHILFSIFDSSLALPFSSRNHCFSSFSYALCWAVDTVKRIVTTWWGFRPVSSMISIPVNSVRERFSSSFETPQLTSFVGILFLLFIPFSNIFYLSSCSLDQLDYKFNKHPQISTD